MLLSAADTPTTIPELLKRAADSWPDQPFLQTRSDGRLSVITYREAQDRARQIAGGLLRAGFQSGDRIALLSENRPEWVLSYLAIVSAGMVVVPLDGLMPIGEIVSILKTARTRALIFSRKFLDNVASLLQVELPEIRCFAIESDGDVNAPHLPYADGENLPSCQPGDVAAVIFTSGTTGFSKGVVLTHGNLCANVAGTIASVPIRQNDNFLLLLPLHHTFSSTVNMLCAIAGGARATFATSYKSRDILEDIRQTQVTLLVGVPLVFVSLMNGINRAVKDATRLRRALFQFFMKVAAVFEHWQLRPGTLLFRSLRKQAGLGSIRLMVSGGAALPPEVNRFFVRLGLDLVQGYGLTETSPVLSVNPPHNNRIGTVGPVISGMQVRIDEPDDKGIGEICARGPCVMQGYFENPEATRAAIRDGWLHTGDAGYLDRHGYLHITGRVKNVIVTGGGKNVYPEEIEAVLNLAPFVLESLVLGVEMKRGRGEELIAYLVPDQGAIAAEQARGTHVDVHEEMRKAVAHYHATAPNYRRIRQWFIREEEFEKTSTRKIKRYLYRDLARNLP